MAFCFQNLRVCSDATVQANAMKGSCGRVFAAYDMAYNLSFLLGLVAGLAASSAATSHTVLAMSASSFICGAVIFACMRRTEEVQVQETDVLEVQPAPVQTKTIFSARNVA
jgi:hypothetical protein